MLTGLGSRQRNEGKGPGAGTPPRTAAFPFTPETNAAPGSAQHCGLQAGRGCRPGWAALLSFLFNGPLLARRKPTPLVWSQEAPLSLPTAWPSITSLSAGLDAAPLCPSSRFLLGFTGEGLPGGSLGNESARNARDLGSIPGSGRSPGGGHGNPLQYSCLENPWTQEPGGYSPWGRTGVTFTGETGSAGPSAGRGPDAAPGPTRCARRAPSRSPANRGRALEACAVVC